MSDPQDFAEALDDDKLDDRDDDFGDDELDDYPPDRPQGVDRMAITPAEEAFPESVEERAAREQRDPLAEELDRSAEEEELEHESHATARLRDDGVEETGDEDDDLQLRGSFRPDSEAWSDEDLEEPIELVSLESVEDDEIDEESDLIADAVRPRGTLPAEEAAVHPTGPAPFRGRDSYLTDEGDEES